VKRYWPTVGWGTLLCVVCRQMYCFTGLVKQEWLVTFWHFNTQTIYSVDELSMFKAVIDVFVYMYIYISEYKCLWSKLIIVNDFPVLPDYEYQFLFPCHVFHIVKYVSVRAVSVAVNEIFVHMYTHLSTTWRSLCNGMNSMIYWFFISKDIGVQ
jgi:hypothetical protein